MNKELLTYAVRGYFFKEKREGISRIEVHDKDFAMEAALYDELKHIREWGYGASADATIKPNGDIRVVIGFDKNPTDHRCSYFIVNDGCNNYSWELMILNNSDIIPEAKEVAFWLKEDLPKEKSYARLWPATTLGHIFERLVNKV